MIANCNQISKQNVTLVIFELTKISNPKELENAIFEQLPHIFDLYLTAYEILCCWFKATNDQAEE